ncbi:hypothetical protein SAMN02910278_01944 [Peptostreptococcus sp. D1]|nr:hypothetical protein SAMN02910278_01944 [Peptostreptococcus sp. D1]
MVTIFDVKKAFNESLKKFTGIEVASKQVDENFDTPVFFTEMEIISSSALNKTFQENNVRLRAIYFPKIEKDQADMLKMIARLEECYRLNFYVKDRVLNVKEIEYDIDEENGYLIFTFKLSYLIAYEKEKYDFMENVEINNK